jgi:hypothetical protein
MKLSKILAGSADVPCGHFSILGFLFQNMLFHLSCNTPLKCKSYNEITTRRAKLARRAKQRSPGFSQTGGDIRRIIMIEV